MTRRERILGVLIEWHPPCEESRTAPIAQIAPDSRIDPMARHTRRARRARTRRMLSRRKGRSLAPAGIVVAVGAGIVSVYPAGEAMRVAALQVTPIKGAVLRHHPDAVEVGPNGVATNRRFYLIDNRGRMFNGKRNGRLARLYADYDRDVERLCVTFPDGECVEDEVVITGEQIETSFLRAPGPWSRGGRAVRRGVDHLRRQASAPARL